VLTSAISDAEEADEKRKEQAAKLAEESEQRNEHVAPTQQHGGPPSKAINLSVIR
jgi:hypothetical protein